MLGGWATSSSGIDLRVAISAGRVLMRIAYRLMRNSRPQKRLRRFVFCIPRGLPGIYQSPKHFLRAAEHLPVSPRGEA
jgi:hypothetical protein